MSDLHTDLVRQEMEESGEMQFIRDHVAAANADASTPSEAATPAEQADTVETQEPVEEVEEQPEGAPPEDAVEENAAEADEPLTPEEEEVLYLELDDDTQALLESKYDGDINAMLRAAREGQSLIGRQGNELGAVRAELEALRKDMQQGLANAQPYPEWPDEYAEPAEAAAQLRAVADTAFTRGDVETFQRALGAWEEADPLTAGMYRDLKEMQIAQAMATQQAPVGNDEATLQAGVASIRTKYPQFQDESFQAAVAAELDKTPSLKAVLWEGVPGVTVEERLNILDEAAARVVARTTSETAQQARRRIAIRTSEEARAARVAAQTLRPDKARETVEEVQPRTVAMGESGRVLNIDRLNEMLPETDRI